ncbi:TIGR01244 family sulfur transferase [Marinobacter sp. AN1]|jgi:sulfide:quinone oxidoreductase|uniref:TIGR01244 family sulfur transferase n=1 Tax=Marinobacter sp. AN1 TaxID=2886046 RepID=UPI00222E9A6F|nr:TIGR01244 family sulfur transferase [Marinobacter sp. AN1]UZD67576.1 TIGR01244 family sulfur transferase [Marinobacter sp. AN1]
MDIRKIDDSISVAPQITPEDVAELARLGFRTLVANRPDREEPGQPAMADIQRAAEENGLKWVFLPVESGNIQDSDVDAFAPMFEEAEKPMLAFCRSGTRCTVLWALSSARHMPLEPIIQRAGQAGYDIRGLVPRLQQQASSHQD